ncbi:MAG: hypothetical protein U9P10_01165 [Thermodesulfobacteriota bacterium]|nr:hypothetical protein [Thermodesulfobacteriota bacterium]
MKKTAALLKPRWWALKNTGFGKGSRQKRASARIRFLVLFFIGAVFWPGIFWVSLRVLSYFSGIEELGDILAFKLLSILLVTLFSLLIFSSLIVLLSKLYLSKDLLLVHAMPVKAWKIFMARWTESLFDSSWMATLYFFPIIAAYGVVYQGGWFFYLFSFSSLAVLAVMACALSALIIMAAVVLVPASRIRTIFVFVGLSLFIALYIGIRVLKPERMVDPEAFSAVLLYLKSMQTPASPLLPSTWIMDAITSSLDGSWAAACFHMALAMSGSGVLVFIMIFTADLIYFNGVSRSKSAAARLFKKRRLEIVPLNFFPGPVKALAVKEIKTFFRDQTQWSQLFLIAALMGIYIYNFKVLPIEKSPIETVYLQNLLSFLNMGLAFFVLTALAGRFVFPAVSMESQSFWLVQASPVTPGLFLGVKFAVYCLPLFIMTLFLIIITNLLLNAVPMMVLLSIVNVCFIVPGVVSLGLGLGAGFADFKSENPGQMVSSYGGLLFMAASAVFIGSVILLEAGPVHALFMARIHHRPLSSLEIAWFVIAFGLAAVICAAAAVLPLRFGEKKLNFS